MQREETETSRRGATGGAGGREGMRVVIIAAGSTGIDSGRRFGAQLSVARLPLSAARLVPAMAYAPRSHVRSDCAASEIATIPRGLHGADGC